MEIWGLHLIDLMVVIVYLVGMLAIGKFLAGRVKTTSDYYLAGRKLGRLYQFFLAFGSMTDASGAASISSETYRQGVGGVWIQFQALFWTPFYWFTHVWCRRVRLVTNADLYTDRLDSKSLGGTYACLFLIQLILTAGWGYLVAYKTVRAMMLKPEAQWTQQEKTQVDNFNQFRQLKSQYTAGTLNESQRAEYETLEDLDKKGELKSFISYLDPYTFYVIYTIIVGAYIVLGGLMAAVFTDAVQSILIIVFSLILIPFGLYELGGFSGLHEAVPNHMFQIFGSVSTSEYTWYSIAAIVISGLVWYGGGAITAGGAAKDETAARVGQVTGAFTKRFLMVAWILCALIALGLFSDQISDPDTTWGVLTVNLLGTGAIGLMLAGILSAQMSSIDAMAIFSSALFVKNLYAPLCPNRSEKHYVAAGRIAVVVVLVLGVAVALASERIGIIELLKDIMSIGVIWGSTQYLIYFWRGLTKKGILVSWIIGALLIGVLPRVLPFASESLRCHPDLLVTTAEQKITVTTGATEEDVNAGRATEVGQTIKTEATIPSVSVYFAKIVRKDPWDPDSPKEGIGRFRVESYLLGKLGLPVEKFSKAGLVTTRFAFNAILPFVLMFIFSSFTKKTDKNIVDRFYVKMKTPVASSPELDAQELEKSYANPQRFDHLKLFPNSKWEMCKWTRMDTVGFVLCWVTLIAVLAVFWLVVNIGS